MASSIDALLSAMKEERKKAKSDEADGFVVLSNADGHWPDLFDTFFLSKATRLAQISNSTTHDDDLVFYVARRKEDDEETVDRSQLVQVFRHHDVKRQPKLASPAYDWEETTYLNLILHQFDYTVTAAICVKDETTKEALIIKSASTRVYASPSRRNMKTKGTEEKISYPDIYFTVDNFEDRFCELYVNEGQMVCVELLAVNPDLEEPKVLFLGSIKYDLLKHIYDERAQTSDRVAQRMTLGMFNKARVEFVRMRGPNKKGHAEMTVSEARSTKNDVAASQSTPSTPVSPKSIENNLNKSQTTDDLASLPSQPSESEENDAEDSETATSPQESADDSGGLFGRRFTQAMSWVRGSTTRLTASPKTLPLQTCLTYINLPCQSLIRDILHSEARPFLNKTVRSTNAIPK